MLIVSSIVIVLCESVFVLVLAARFSLCCVNLFSFLFRIVVDLFRIVAFCDIMLFLLTLTAFTMKSRTSSEYSE